MKDMFLKNRTNRFLSTLLRISFCVFLGAASLAIVSCGKRSDSMKPIKIGVLYSQTGGMAIEDKPIMESIVLAVEEINKANGLLGHLLQIVTFDARSDAERYITGAKQLLEEEKVVAIFGGGNSVSRRNIRPIIEEHKSILIYPMHYEGGEASPNIVYLGAAPNQQIIPGVSWAMRNLGTRFYLVGSDAIYSHVVNAIIKDLIYALNGEVVGESYIAIDNNSEIDGIIERIDAARPDAILNTIDGISNIEFFKQLREAGVYPDSIPTVSFGLTENLLRHLSAVGMEGDYGIWSYFQSLDTPENKIFEQNFYKKYGKGRAIDDPMESAYIGVYIWAQAVVNVRSFNPARVLKSIESQSFLAPSGLIYMDSETHGAYMPVRLGMVQPDKQYKAIWNSEISVMPERFTLFRTPDEWDQLIKDLYEKWGRQWFRGKE